MLYAKKYNILLLRICSSLVLGICIPNCSAKQAEMGLAHGLGSSYLGSGANRPLSDVHTAKTG